MDHAHRMYSLTPTQDGIDHGRLVLSDGTTARLRPAGRDDQAAFASFLARLSPESRYTRFMSAAVPRDVIAHWCEESRPEHALTLVATRAGAGGEEIVATGSYEVTTPGCAEVAFAVRDDLQGRGLGTLLLERLAREASEHGFHRFEAVCLGSNDRMQRVFRDSGFRVEARSRQGTTSVVLDLHPAPLTVARVDERDRSATIASLVPFFSPRTIAVVGASRDPASLGHRIVKQLAAAGFTGRVAPVNPHAREIADLPCYARVADVPERVDLAVIVTPVAGVLDAVRACGEAGVRAVVVITAGFAEVGPAGLELQRAVVDEVRGRGMRMVGPNCLGIVNTDPAVRLDASFAPVVPPAGSVAMCSQSGALGLALLSLARELGLGVSSFVSIGNKADVSGNDLLQYWEADARTRVILLYLESLGNPRRFARIARRVARVKPIVCVKAGRTASGRRAAGSHTAAIAGEELSMDALFAQTGVLRVDTLEEMFDLAALLAMQPLPAGPRVAIVTNAGGPAILCADACEAGGLEVARPSAATHDALVRLLPAAASVANPIDMIASATPEQFRAVIELLLGDEAIDAVVFIHVPLGPGEADRVRAAVAEAVTDARARGIAKPVAGCLLAAGGTARSFSTGEESVPVYAFPESAGRALARAARHAAALRVPAGDYIHFEDIDVKRARAAVEAALSGRDEAWLTASQVDDVLSAFGMPRCTARLVRTADDAVAAASSLGYPVALKGLAHGVTHKSDLGLVHLGLADEASVRGAWKDVVDALDDAGLDAAADGHLVQRMAAPGVEVMAGLTHDPAFGPVVAFGLGGVNVEALRDVAFRVTPLTDRDAASLPRSIRARRLLEGIRGRPACDFAAIEELLLRLSRLADLLPEVAELDLNPVIALPAGAGCRIVDARILARSHPRRLARGLQKSEG
jgi:acetyl coenzyme A synthetase (ADP forming)-like protein